MNQRLPGALRFTAAHYLTGNTPMAIVALALLILSPHLLATGAIQGVPLLSNGGFEQGMVGWTLVSSTASPKQYDGPLFNLPDSSVATKISGGGHLLKDGGDAIVEQIVTLPEGAEGMNLHAGGYFGGFGSFKDNARLVIRFLDQASNELSRKELDNVSAANRNYETVLMRREVILAIPRSAAKIAARIEFTSSLFSDNRGMADEVFAELVTTSQVPDPLPLGTNLLTNHGFDQGWKGTSPLSLNDVHGWEGAGAGPVVVRPYSNSVGAIVPTTSVSTVVGGGGSLLSGSDPNSVSSVRQRIDARGNGDLSVDTVLHVSAYLGGVGGFQDSAQVSVHFLNDSFNLLPSEKSLGPVSPAERNRETVVMKRERDYAIPPTTAFIDIQIDFAEYSFTDPDGLADNLSAMLIPAVPVSPVLLKTNLLSNGSFESNAALPGSPLELANSQGWAGTLQNSGTAVTAYGVNSNVPAGTFASTNGLGGRLLSDGSGGGALHEFIDLSGDQSSIDAGLYSASASAWLGGVGSFPDTAELIVNLLDDNGNIVEAKSLGPVTAAERMNTTTLISKKSEFPIPSGIRALDVEIRFTAVGLFSTGQGLADGIQVKVFANGNGGVGNSFGVLGFSKPPYVAKESDAAATVEVSRSGGKAGEVTVNYATSDGSATAGDDFTPVNGTLTFPTGTTKATFTIPILNSSIVEGLETVLLTLSAPTGGATLGNNSTAVLTIADDDSPQVVSVSSGIGESTLVKLTGPGTVAIAGSRQSGNGDSAFSILLEGTDATSKLSVKVSKGDGFVSLDSLAAAGSLKSLSAKGVNVTGSGIELGGYLGSLAIHDLADGASIIAAGVPAEKTKLTMHVIGDGGKICLGSALAALNAARIGTCAITAPSAGALSIKGEKKQGITGDFLGSVTLDGLGVEPGKLTLSKFSAAGAVMGAVLDVSGNIGSVSAAQILMSAIFAGFIPQDDQAPLSGGVFDPIASIKSVKATGASDSFVASFVVAGSIGSVVFNSAVIDNGGVAFGILIGPGGTLKSAKIKSPVFTSIVPGAGDQSIGDFHVLQ